MRTVVLDKRNRVGTSFLLTQHIHQQPHSYALTWRTWTRLGIREPAGFPSGGDE